jgi:two-component system, LuxR family, response regulator FixJ
MAYEATICVVDDDRTILEATALSLEAEGLAVRTYSSAETLLNSIEEHPCGCVITDMRMPKMTGLELLTALAERNITSPVIVVSANGSATLAVEALKRGAVDFLEKPFARDDLLSAIRKALNYENGQGNGNNADDARNPADSDEGARL